MYIEERLEFIESLAPLAPLPTLITRSFANLENEQGAVKHDESKPTASVMPDTINTFFPGISTEIIDDVNLCKLVMQNAASKKYPKEEQLSDWYKYYVDGLSKLGWVIQNKQLKDVTIKRIGLTMDQIAVEIVAGLLGPQAASTLAYVAQKALVEVKKGQRTIEIFNSNKDTGKTNKFEIAPVFLDASGQPNMVLNYVSMNAQESTRGILFWKSTSQSTSIKSGATRAYLDRKVFSRLSDSLYDKFTEAGKKYIIDLPDF
ncbi:MULTISPECIES: hypothetical protein [Pseudomonas]|jgi:hypothetical protein|uniref:hypothetical protein n=1 Tax=Pseudomonas TaxID=286 RepID=UPI000D85C856|nr:MULTISPECIES: hypothetical protein [Pseudomonas]MCK8684655.1 hypothetical protein [Pseudomonas umsongensis]MDI3393609.1 hypothetical protein [Pseudomonas sp. V98_8]MDP9691191.1 hypothetical protein [Pseudomonas mohnii]